MDLPSVVTSVSTTNHSKLVVSTRNQLLLVDKNKKNHEEYIRLDTLEKTCVLMTGNVIHIIAFGLAR